MSCLNRLRSRSLAAGLATLAAVASLLAPGAVAPAGATGTTTADMEHEFRTLLNGERAARGLPPLIEDVALAPISREWSATMAYENRLYHRPDQKEQITSRVTTKWTRIGENVGYGPTVAGLHKAFMESPPHFENVVGQYNRLGVGVVQHGGTIWVTFNFMEGPALTVHQAFADIPQGTYYYEPVDWAWKTAITGGKTASSFDPGGAVTRAQAVTFLWRAAGKPAGGSHSFTDVPRGSYYEQAVAWASNLGITGGTTSTTFSPGRQVTRAQMVTFQWRAAGEPAGGSHSFVDVPKGSYFEGAVVWASDNGVTGGTTPTTFAPADGVTRAQAVTFLHRAR